MRGNAVIPPLDRGVVPLGLICTFRAYSKVGSSDTCCKYIVLASGALGA